MNTLSPQLYQPPDPTRSQPGARTNAEAYNGIAAPVAYNGSRLCPIAAVKPPVMDVASDYEIADGDITVTPPACIGHVRVIDLNSTEALTVAAGARNNAGQYLGDRASHRIIAWGPRLPFRIMRARSTPWVTSTRRNTSSVDASTSTVSTYGAIVLEDTEVRTAGVGSPRTPIAAEYDALAYGQRWGEYGPLNLTSRDLEAYSAAQDACEDGNGLSSAVTTGTPASNALRATQAKHGLIPTGSTFSTYDYTETAVYVRDVLHYGADVGP